MAPINLVFYLAIFTNGKVLQYSTVETFIAFRSLTPLLVSTLDTLVRGEPRPSLRTMATLFSIAAGAATYAYDDANFTVVGYSWALVYLAIIVTEMVYAKHITSTINLSTWGLVLYQNTIALALFPVAGILTGEIAEVRQVVFDSGNAKVASVTLFAIVPLAVSCVFGVGISFAGWGARSSISATQFTVLGVACKLATVGMNIVVWQYHAPLFAQMSIVMCIVASVAYQQSAKRDKEYAKIHRSGQHSKQQSGIEAASLLNNGGAKA